MLAEIYKCAIADPCLLKFISLVISIVFEVCYYNLLAEIYFIPTIFMLLVQYFNPVLSFRINVVKSVLLFSSLIFNFRIDRQKQKKTVEFQTLHRQYIEVWDQFHDNLYENEQPHTNYNFRAYLTWYLGVTRTRLKIQWTQADYAYLESSEDEDTSYDLAARQGTLIEAAPVLDRVVHVLSTIQLYDCCPFHFINCTYINYYMSYLIGQRNQAICT